MFNEKEVNRRLGYILAVIAAATGLTDNIRYAHVLQIEPSEYRRYFRKTANISSCYAGFAQRFSLDQARGAGHAAFLTCAYDVVTDWGKSPSLQNAFASILYARTSPELANMGLDLLDRDTRGVLADDGLERGVVTLEFLLRMMNVRGVFARKCDIRQIGLNLQIVDDVLDYEDDVVMGDQNCLTNLERRESYLGRLKSDLSDSTLRSVFPYGKVLIYTIKLAQDKAEKMLIIPEKYFR